MSQQVDRSPGGDDTPGRGLDALRRSPAFQGPVEPLDEHDHAHDHFALVYEGREEQFDCIVPFVRQGLDRNEQCMYIADNHSRAEIIAELQAGGIDAAAAIESGDLSIHTTDETYLEDGSFDPDDMIAFLEGAIADAKADYESLRVAAEMTWVFGEDPSVEDLVDYEGKVNELFSGGDIVAVCQYDEARFPPAVIRDVVRTHPMLIRDNVVSHNVYYTPPGEFFGPDDPEKEVDRMLATLRERTEAKAELKEYQESLREQNEITADPDRDFEEKLQALFELGCERFDLDLGGMARIDRENDRFMVERVSGDHEYLQPDTEVALSETYCRVHTSEGQTAGIADPVEDGFEGSLAYEEFGVNSYLGTRIGLDDDLDRTLFFVSTEPRKSGFTEAERTFLDLMGQWVGYELERRRREEYLHESYEITSDTTLSFEEKVEQLLELGCERFDLEMAGLNHLPSWDGEFRLETGVGLDLEPESEPQWTDPGEGCFCRQTILENSPVCQVDVRGTKWEDDCIHEELGLTSYFGTKVTSGSTPYGTLWFASKEPRERPFTDAQRTFLDLIGQWVSYEIERREHKQSQRALYKITANNDLSTDEKIDRLLAAGRQHLDLRIGALNRETGGSFVVEKLNSTHPEFDDRSTVSSLRNDYCRRVVDTGEPFCTVEAGSSAGGSTAGESTPPHVDDLKAYAGIPVSVDGTTYGSLCFLDTKPRAEPFTEAELAFLDLMSQCVGYELERRQHKADLEKTIDQLQQSNDRLKQFAYAASHDLQEPLRMVSSYLQLLEDQYGDDLDETAREYVDFAVDGAERMREMVDDLLAYSRVEQSGGELERVDTADVLDRVRDDLQARIEKTDATVTAESLPTVRADRDQLEQLFRNLVSNGIKYNEEDPTVEVDARKRARCWEFTVADDGIGIDPGKTDRIFEVFKRLHHDDEYTGTGIGLSLCQEIVENHGGDIWVESEPGAGSTFHFTLPMSDAQ